MTDAEYDAKLQKLLALCEKHGTNKDAIMVEIAKELGQTDEQVATILSAMDIVMGGPVEIVPERKRKGRK